MSAREVGTIFSIEKVVKVSHKKGLRKYKKEVSHLIRGGRASKQSYNLRRGLVC